MKIIYDFRQNLNTGHDGQVYISIPEDDSECIVIGTWSGVLNSSSGSCIITELNPKAIVDYLSSYRQKEVIAGEKLSVNEVRISKEPCFRPFQKD